MFTCNDVVPSGGGGGMTPKALLTSRLRDHFVLVAVTEKTQHHKDRMLETEAALFRALVCSLRISHPDFNPGRMEVCSCLRHTFKATVVCNPMQKCEERGAAVNTAGDFRHWPATHLLLRGLMASRLGSLACVETLSHGQPHSQLGPRCVPRHPSQSPGSALDWPALLPREEA